jgi:hypothetical protein
MILQQQQERKDESSTALLTAVRSQAETVESGHLSGQGLFAAANFDPRVGAENPDVVVRLWTQLDDAQQRPWKEKALANQKSFALRALTKPSKSSNTPASKKRTFRGKTENEE